MGAIYEALVSFTPLDDTELLDGYRRYEALLEEQFTANQLAVYADYLRQTGAVRIFEELTPTELAALPTEVQEIAAEIMATINLSMENRRVAALLHTRGEDRIAPDFGSATGPAIAARS